MYRLQVKTHFDAAHSLRDYEGKCRRMHGHRWDVEICLQGKELRDGNMLVDFAWLKRKLNELLETYCDHYCLNDSLHEANPTAEFLAKWLFDEFVSHCSAIVAGVELVRTCVWESPDCCVKYSPDMESVNG